MTTLGNVLLFTLIAGLAMPFGALLARIDNLLPGWLSEEFRHTVMAFGGGALISAIALVLVPEGIAILSTFASAGWFVVGGLSFMLLDIILKRLNTPASQLAAMLADFIPESIALGAAFATGSINAFLLAGLITLQNIPEGFNAFRELNGRFSGAKILQVFFLMALFGPMAGLLGYLWLADEANIIAAVMLFASGGILYAVFEDIAPNVPLDAHWAPPMGAIFGFVLGMIGFSLTHS